MSGFVIRKTLLTIPALIMISLASFSLILLIPGDPAHVILGDFADPASIERLRHQLGLDQPVGVRYLDWVGGIARGDFGESIRYHRSVVAVIQERIAPTLWLSAGAFFISTLVSIPVGVMAAAKRGGIADRILSYVTTGGLAIPEFLMGALLIYFFAVKMHWLPSSGYMSPIDDPIEAFRHLILPWICLASVSAAAVAKMVRSAMLEVLEQDYIRTATSKGLNRSSVLRRHALRNAMLSVLTLMGLIARNLVGGAVIVETLFAIPGIGSLLVSSVLSHDYPMVQGLVLYLGFGVIMISLVVDISYGILDPRVKYS